MAATLQQQPINLNQQNGGGGGVVHQILQGTSPAPPQQQQQQQILFTVEQIELVRRLRNSGITKEQLVLAFDSLDRLDRELGPVYSIPISQMLGDRMPLLMFQAFTQQLFARQVLAAASAVPIIHQQPPPPVTSPPQCTPPPPPPPPHQLPPLAPLQHPQPQRSPQLNGTCSPRRVPTPNKTAVVVGGLSAHIEQKENYINFKAEPMNLSGEEPMITTSTPPPPNGEALNFSVSLGDLVLNPVEDIKDDNTEFICFAAQGEPACCDQIRAYVAKYNIRQQQIATLSRISQSYVSRFLKGDFFDMSERSRRAIKKWYIAYRNNPAAIAVAVNLVLLSHGAQNGNSPPSSTCAGSATSSSTPKLSISDLTAAASAVPPQPNPEFLNQRRRERFVFRPNHLEILEKHFQEDSYPSFEKREEMARLCNAATESLTGRPLGDKEVVTAQIVSNWFANKRKEMKKLAREEGLDLSQVPLRNRGRPCRFFGDLMAQIQEGQNSRDSGAIDMETAINGHLHEAQMLMNNESNAAATAVAANYRRKEQQDSNSGAVGDASNGGGGSGSDDIVTVIPRAPEETAAEEEAAAAAAMSGNSSHDERTLSLSVELAAVNQAILSLTGQQPLSAAAAITTSAASSHAPHTPVMCIPSTAAATATTIQQLTTTTTTTTTATTT